MPETGEEGIEHAEYICDTRTQGYQCIHVGGGWFMTRNVVTKIEYVRQAYAGDAWTGRFAGAEFNGIVLVASISF